MEEKKCRNCERLLKCIRNDDVVYYDRTYYTRDTMKKYCKNYNEVKSAENENNIKI